MSKPEAKHLLFVYGTLKRGFPNHHYLKGAKFLGHAAIRGQMFDLGSCPGIIPATNPIRDIVFGELWEVTTVTRAACDRLEGHPFLYKRERTCIFSAEQVQYQNKAWVYWFHGLARKSRHIPGGIWTQEHNRAA